MTIENEKLSEVEMEYLLTLIAKGGSDYENVYVFSLKQFSGGSLGEIKVADPDILSGLERKGMIEIQKGSEFAIYKSTQKGFEYAEKRVKGNWGGRDSYRRWRKVFFDTKQRMMRQRNEEIIMRLLLYNSSVSLFDIRQKIKDMPVSEIKSLASGGGFEWSGYPSKAIRGVKFPQVAAKILHSKELSGDLKEAEFWRKEMNRIMSFPDFRDGRTSKEWRNKFDSAYRLAVESSACPMGLSKECATEFKRDPDCLNPQKHLSSSDFTLTIKCGFGYRGIETKRLKYTTKDIVMEISQPIMIAVGSEILIKRPICEMVKIFQSVIKEFENMRKEMRIGFSIMSKPIGVKIEFENDYAILKFPVLVEDKKSKMSFATFKESEEIFKQLQKK